MNGESMTVIPLKGNFENPKAFLLQIAEDEEIQGFCMVVYLRDGTVTPAHIFCSRSDLAFSGALLTQMALDGDDK
jgi:hypothetical protein